MTNQIELPNETGSAPPDSEQTLLAVDVGAETVRAALFDVDGRMICLGVREVPALRPRDGQVVHRMDAIWGAVGGAIRDCLDCHPLGMAHGAATVAGIGFDAVSALVLTHDGAPPLEGGADVIGWADRRAEAEAREISASGDAWLQLVGGAVPPDHHFPKLLWLRRHAPEAWSRVTAPNDLADELAYRATGRRAHAQATLAMRWPFQAEPGTAGGEWMHGLLGRFGLEDLWMRGGLSNPPLPTGGAQGALSDDAAAALGLRPGIPVAAGLTEALAGMLGALGRAAPWRAQASLALIGRGATGFMAMSASPRAIPGLWGPIPDCPLPGFWLHEGAQPCSLAALDAVLADHPGGPRLSSAQTHAAVCEEILALLATEGPAFGARRHLVPDWLGNRTPIGDAALGAMETGVGQESGYRAFLEAYFATARALALQARQIVLHLNRHGYAITRATLAGEQAGNRLLVRLYRDALGVDVLQLDCPEPVLLGAAMAASVAAGMHPDIGIAVERMSSSGLRYGADPVWRRGHDAVYRIYLKLAEVRNVVARESRLLERIGGG